jgi:Arrestin (or S-antigen), N-terminal domain
MAGEWLKGTVKVIIDQKAHFDAESISIRLNGVEKASFIPEADEKEAKDIRPIRLTETIIDLNYVLHEFPNFMSIEGHSSFPFTLKLPEWLPESVMLKDGSITLAVIYFLTAQLDPREDEFFADKKAELSLCRDERMIVIYGKHTGLFDLFGGTKPGNEDRLTKRLDAKVGGLFGIAAKNMTAFISITKEEFAPTEDIMISLNIDNSQCSKEIKS